MDPFVAALTGFGTGAGLIIAIGAQNAYLLRQGLVQPARIVALLVLICAGADALLIVAGVAGMGAVFTQFPTALEVFRWFGVVFLGGYAVLAARRAFRAEVLEVGPDSAPTSLKVAALAIAGFTFLNPHVYLDTVILVGSLANQQPDALRWWFTFGAVAASFFWFSALGFGARLLRPLFARATTWRVLDIVIAAVMATIALSLAFNPLGHG